MKLENIIPLLYFILCFFCFVLFIFFILFLLIKKLSRPMYSNSISSSVLKDKQGNFLFSHSDQLNRFAEHYSELADCEKYGVNIGRKKCCGGLFADDVVLIAPSAKNLEKLLKKVHRWANLNEMK